MQHPARVWHRAIMAMMSSPTMTDAMYNLTKTFLKLLSKQRHTTSCTFPEYPLLSATGPRS